MFRAALRMVVEKALEKDPTERYQSMREMVVDLRRLMRQSNQTMADLKVALEDVTEESGSGKQVRHARSWPLGLGRAVAGAAGCGFLRLANVARAGEYGAAPSGPAHDATGVHRYPSFSPDGNTWRSRWNGPKQDNPDIYVQQIGAGTAFAADALTRATTTTPSGRPTAAGSPSCAVNRKPARVNCG